MYKRMLLVLKSLLRITVLPIVVFFIFSGIVIYLIEPTPYKQGCMIWPENPKQDLIFGWHIVVLYLYWTPTLLLNLIGGLVKRRVIRIIVLLIPAIPTSFDILMISYFLLSVGFARIGL